MYLIRVNLFTTSLAAPIPWKPEVPGASKEGYKPWLPQLFSYRSVPPESEVCSSPQGRLPADTALFYSGVRGGPVRAGSHQVFWRSHLYHRWVFIDILDAILITQSQVVINTWQCENTTIENTTTPLPVTTMRKILTVVLSFIFFTKPFTEQYVWSGSLVLLGISKFPEVLECCSWII